MRDIDRQALANELNDTLGRAIDRSGIEKVPGAAVMDAVTAFVARLVASVIVDNEMTEAQRHTLLAALHKNLDTSIETHLAYFQGQDEDEETDPRRMN
jgi:hypothetical protein